MNQDITFGKIVKEKRTVLGLTQAELGRQTGCASIVIRKIEAGSLHVSEPVAKQLAMALHIPEGERAAFIPLASDQPEPVALPSPAPVADEIGQEDLSGRAIRGYELGDRIAVGGFGAIYRATQQVVKREVAIKIILPQYADHPDFIRRFEAEAQFVARLEHPHIVPLYDYWREPGGAYLIMRLMRGGSLFERLKKGSLSLDVSLRVLQQIGAALHSAHQARIIHRDLKPANILLDEAGNAYLADFGFAKDLGTANLAEQSEAGTVVGSLEYISPEQIQAEPVNPQTDIYCLGVVLYELLSGQKPFRGPTPIDFIQQHLNQALPSLAETFSKIDPATLAILDAVIARATAKDPGERYPDVLALMADFQRAVAVPTPLSETDQPLSATEAGSGHSLEFENPYKGLRAFGEADADDFYGREAFVQGLLGRMEATDDLSRFLAVVGPSGSGKSSLVRAGLVPALRAGGLPNSENWFIADFMPGAHPMEELEVALMRVAINPPENLLDQLLRDERGLSRIAKRILPQDQGYEHRTELVLIIDQFEELFTLVSAEPSRSHFLSSLVEAVLDPRSRIRVVITMRADFTDRPLQYIDFGDLVRQRTEFVVPLAPEELEEAIVQPATRKGLIWEAGLVSMIMRELGEQPGSLPMLQYALTDLFEQRDGRRLTVAAYQASGGVLGALASRAEELYQGLDSVGKEAVRQLFLRLVTLGEGVEDTRRRVSRAELTALSNDSEPAGEGAAINDGQALSDTADSTPAAFYLRPPSVMDKVIDLYGRYRLLTFDHDPVNRGSTVEVAHEALLREWSLLRTWLDASRADIRLQRLLAAAAAEWTEAGREPGFLLRGARLDQFEGWPAGTDMALTYNERAFLRTSLAARRARRADEELRQRRELEAAQTLAETQRQAAWRFRWLSAGLAAFLLLAVGAAWFALSQRNSAQASFARAENNFVTSERIRLAAQAQIALENGEGGDLPALLALRSLKLGYSPEADAALLSALRRGFTRQRYIGHTDAIRNVVFSHDGQHVLTASADGTARLWDGQSGKELQRFEAHTYMNSAIFSPDDRYVLTGGRDQTARMWEVETGLEVRHFSGHSGGAWGLAFSPDGRYVVTADNTMARLWDAETGEQLRQFVGHTNVIGWVDYSPDGRYIATAGDTTARLWDIETGMELRKFVGHTDNVGTVRFSPDGQRLLTESDDRTARLWDIGTGLEARRFIGHTELLYDAVFSPDGRQVLTGSFDKTARLWDVESGHEIRQFIGHTGGVGPVYFSADGQYVLTGSLDRTARLWDVWIETEPNVLDISLGAKAASGLNLVTLSPDDRFVLTGNQSFGASVVRLRDIQSKELVREITLDLASINDQAISPDRRHILTGSGDNMARLWNAESGQEIGQFAGHDAPIRKVTFSPDGRHILTGSEDNTARLWSTETAQEINQFTGHDGTVLSIVFSEDGRLILTGSEDSSARLWDAETGDEIQQFLGHLGSVLDVAISPDGRHILTGSADNTARLWDVTSGQEIHRLIGHTDQVVRVALSPDSRYAVTGSADQSARLWETQSGQLLRHFVGHVSSLLFVGFSADGQHILTGDTQSAFTWRTTLEDVISFACTQLTRDFTDEERTFYNITDNTSTCPEFADRTVTVEPTWTPMLEDAKVSIPTLDLEPTVRDTTQVLEMVFDNDAANLQFGAPMQDVYIENSDGQIVRPQDVSAATLAQPLFRATELIEPDFLEEPFEIGPFERGEPHGFTLEKWLAATGYGTYTVTSDQATVELNFEDLIANGVYTLWCSEIHLAPNTNLIDRPCGAPDGSENVFIADEGGTIELAMDIDVFPPTTAEIIYSFGLAYHSDGQTHGPLPGDFGYNLHVQLFYELPPPGEQ